MTAFAARHFDGRSSAARPVSVELMAGELRLRHADGETRIPRQRARVGDRLGGAARVIYLAGAGELHSDDHAAVDELARQLGQGRLAAGVFRLESRLWIALVAVAISAAAVFFGLRHGLPLLAATVAERLPPGIEASLGGQSLAALDRLVLRPSKLPAQRGQALRQRLQSVCARVGDCPPWRLEFRAGGEIGANALALPGGILVFTDEIVNLARHDDELIAVAAHELGHLRQRHALRQLLAASGVTLLARLWLGDIGGVGELVAGVPVLLLRTGYSRAMEREADAAALTLMRRACLPPRRFADLLLRLDAERPGAGMMLFSSHPETRQRIKVFQAQELVTRGC